MKNSGAAMRALFEPQSVAVIGASGTPGKIGYTVVKNILDGGFTGRVFPVNPKGGEILGLAAPSSVGEIGEPLDLACVTTPAPTVPDIVAECAGAGVKNLVVITSGFSEVGDIETERRLVETARRAGTRVLGPNVFGLYASKVRLNATFGPSHITAGGLAIISQSGAIGIAMIGKTAAEGIGLSAIISVGNKADLDEADLLSYLTHDPATKVVAMYIEGVKNGSRFVEAVREATRVKPVVVIKSGWSQRGAVAAASHTGSLAGADDVFDDVMRQCGVLRAETIEEAFNWSLFLASAPKPKGDKTLIVTNGGGIGVLATDASEKFGVKLYDDPARLEEKFRKVVPEFGSVKNPVDLTGQAGDAGYANALDTALAMNDIHAVIALYCETAVLDEAALGRVLAEKGREYQSAKPIVYSLFGGQRLETVADGLRHQGLSVSGDVYNAVSNLGALFTYHRFRAQKEEKYEDVAIDLDAVTRVVAGARAEKRTFLLAREGAAVMEAIGVRMPKTRVVRTLEQVIAAAENEIGYPVVLKVVSRDILHKSDAGGVALDLEDRKELIEAYQAILHNCRKRFPKAHLEGLEVAQMVPRGVETIVGARRDAVFGPIVMFGLGGIYVEVMKDVVFRLLPVSRRLAAEMTSSIRSYPMLLGVRGEEPKDLARVHDAVLRVGELVRRCPEITDVEVNPLMVYEQGQGCLAVDARILIAQATE
ncbi:MAG: acetate--CoA ligase family protein [Deltaproteobacteria bacterium]|nr:acetate--CoA ligase family protein [Deltaproteobacteria bacterium]